MAVSDPVADFLTGIRNALRAKHRKVDVPASRLKAELAKVLLRERYINNFKLIDDQRQGVLRVYLKCATDERSVISGLRRISTPGRRVYARTLNFGVRFHFSMIDFLAKSPPARAISGGRAPP